MKQANDHLKLARNRLLPGRTTTIVGTSLMSEAVDAARKNLDILIKHLDGDGSVSNVHQALGAIAALLGKFEHENDDVRAAYLDVVEAELLIQASTYEAAPGGEITKRPRR